MTELNIISDLADKDLGLIRRKLGGKATPAGSVERALEIVNQAARAGAQVATLNLIGHSNGDHLLMIGSPSADGWTLGADAPETIRINFLSALRTLGVTAIRLLGCSTATTQAGWRVMHGIVSSLAREQLRIVGWGTTRLITEVDYDEHEFTSNAALVSTAELPSSHAPPIEHLLGTYGGAAIDLLLGPGVLQLDDDVLRVDRPFRLLLPDARLWALIDCRQGWSLPGLHAAPMAELVLPVDPTRPERGVWIEVLLDHALVRVFPTGRSDPYGLIYRVVDPAALAALAASAQRSPSSKL